MSGISGAPAPGEYGLLSTLVADSASIRQRLDALAQQASTGLVASTYAGLGAGASVSLDLNPEIADLQTWQDNIAAVTGRMGVTQTAMTQLQQIASSFYAKIDALNGIDAPTVDTIAASARDALKQVAGLLDTRDGGVFVFGGADSANPPVPDPDAILSSGFYTQIASAVNNLSTAGASATASATLAIASSNAAGTSPFSAYMSQPASTLQAQAPVVQTGPGQTSQIGLLASANSFAASPSGSTTGSYARDLFRSLATLGSLSSAQANLPGFVALIQDTRASLNGAIGAMAGEAGAFGDRQSALTMTQASLGHTQLALTTQVGASQDADMAQTLSAITQTQAQLQASYQVIATLSSLSLAKILPAGA